MPGKKPYPFGSPTTIKRSLARAHEQLEIHKKKRKHNHTKKQNTTKRKHGPSVWNSNSNNNNTVKHRKTHHN